MVGQLGKGEFVVGQLYRKRNLRFFYVEMGRFEYRGFGDTIVGLVVISGNDVFEEVVWYWY